MSTPLRLAIALSLMATTAGCTSQDWDQAIKNLTGDQQEADTHIQTLTDQVNNLAQNEQDMSLMLTSSSPPTADNTNSSSEEPVSSSEEALTYGMPGYVCTPIFRQLSCDDQGKPHDLDPNTMEWID